MNTFQIIIFAAFVTGFFRIIYVDINGRKAQEPLWFAGVVISILAYALLFWVYTKAGTFSTLFPSLGS